MVWVPIFRFIGIQGGKKVAKKGGKKFARKWVRKGYKVLPSPRGVPGFPFGNPFSQSRSSQDTGLPSTYRKARPGTSYYTTSRGLGSKRGKAKRGPRRSYRGRKPRPPYCRVHKRNHWCKYTRK